LVSSADNVPKCVLVCTAVLCMVQPLMSCQSIILCNSLVGTCNADC